MIKKAIEYIVELSTPTFHESGIKEYSDRKMYEVDPKPYADPIKLHTLNSLIDYIRSGFDGMESKMFIHVVSPTEVRLYSTLDDENRRREIVAIVNAEVPSFLFGEFVPHENFCIGVQAKFQETEDRALLLKFAGTVQSGTVAEYGDDGISQKATVKTGISTKSEAIVPNPVKLAAYRTFIEVDQPAAQYVFRMKDDKYNGVQCVLFEADGGAWRIEAMKSISQYLKTKLNGFTDYIVIS